MQHGKNIHVIGEISVLRCKLRVIDIENGKEEYRVPVRTGPAFPKTRCAISLLIVSIGYENGPSLEKVTVATCVV
jgi:hypothetical protein